MELAPRRIEERWICLISLGLLVAAPLRLGFGQDGVDPRTIARAFVDELQADDFQTRQDASAGLIDLGTVAIDTITERLGALDREGLDRALAILFELALSPDQVVAERSLAELAKASSQGEERIQRAATPTLERLRDRLEDRARSELEALGVRFRIVYPTFPTNLLVELRTVEIDGGFRGEGRDLSSLRHLRNVDAIVFANEHVQPDWFASLPTMDCVQMLTIRKSPITDETLQIIGKIPRLLELHILYSPLDDETASRLESFGGLRFIRLYGSGPSRESLDRLAQKLATTKIDYRKGGLLGVKSQPDQRSCVVSGVPPGTAAAQAGIQQNDQIVRIAGSPVATFEDLTRVIGKFAPEEVVSVEFFREGVLHVRQVKLGYWDQ